MSKSLAVIIFFVLTQFAAAEEITAEKKRIIDEMLALTGALKAGEMLGTAVTDQMINAMAQQNTNIDARTIEVLKDEVGKIMHDEFIANGFINEVSYEVYHKYFSTAELKEMLAFYKTPTGKKMASLLPRVTQESMMAGQRRGQTLGPIIQQRLRARFEKEGITLGK